MSVTTTTQLNSRGASPPAHPHRAAPPPSRKRAETRERHDRP